MGLLASMCKALLIRIQEVLKKEGKDHNHDHYKNASNFVPKHSAQFSQQNRITTYHPKQKKDATFK
jgi:hypothetical protein